MSLSLALALLLSDQDAQGPKIDTPRSLLACGTDASLESSLCRATVSSEQKRYVEAATAFEEAAPLAGRHLEGKLPDVVIVDERADRDDLSSPRR